MLRAASPVGTVLEERRRRKVSGLILGAGIFLLLLVAFSTGIYCLLAPDPIRLGSLVLLGPRCSWAVPLEWGNSTIWDEPGLGRKQAIEVNRPDVPSSYGVQIMECPLPTEPRVDTETTLVDGTSSTTSSSPSKVRVVVGSHIRKWGPFTLVSP